MGAYELLSSRIEEAVVRRGERFFEYLANSLEPEELEFLDGIMKKGDISKAVKKLGIDPVRASEFYSHIIRVLGEQENTIEERVQGTITTGDSERKNFRSTRTASEEPRQEKMKKAWKGEAWKRPRLESLTYVNHQFSEYLREAKETHGISYAAMAGEGTTEAQIAFYAEGIGMPTWQEEKRIRDSIEKTKESKEEKA
jgi:hypothetical protein